MFVSTSRRTLPLLNASDAPLRSYSCLCSLSDTATTQIYTLSLHDALPISCDFIERPFMQLALAETLFERAETEYRRSEEHTSELQSRRDLVCRLLLEKKKRLSKASRCTRRSHCSSRSTRLCSAGGRA